MKIIISGISWRFPLFHYSNIFRKFRNSKNLQAEDASEGQIRWIIIPCIWSVVTVFRFAIHNCVAKIEQCSELIFDGIPWNWRHIDRTLPLILEPPQVLSISGHWTQRESQHNIQWLAVYVGQLFKLKTIHRLRWLLAGLIIFKVITENLPNRHCREN